MERAHPFEGHDEITRTVKVSAGGYKAWAEFDFAESAVSDVISVNLRVTVDQVFQGGNLQVYWTKNSLGFVPNQTIYDQLKQNTGFLKNIYISDLVEQGQDIVINLGQIPLDSLLSITGFVLIGRSGLDMDIRALESGAPIRLEIKHGTLGTGLAGLKIDTVGVASDRFNLDGSSVGYVLYATDEEALYFKTAEGWTEPIPFGRSIVGEPGIPGPTGEPFTIDVIADDTERNRYINEKPGFSFLSKGDNILYILGPNKQWHEGIPFTGARGPLGEKGVGIESFGVDSNLHLIVVKLDNGELDTIPFNIKGETRG